MKKAWIFFVVGLVAGIVIMFMFQSGSHVIAQGTPSGNGDVNASGGIDIADAIYLLTYLFAKGPVPEPIESPACDSCCPPCPPFSLPATGQTACYDTDGNVIDCASADWPGQDGFYQKGCPTANRFVDNGDWTVTDTCTGLMWQESTAHGTYTWQDALKYCESVEDVGHSDWRLPNIRELLSIVDYGRSDLKIDPVFGAESNWYWSSTTSAGYPGGAWGVGFHSGDVNDHGKAYVCFVRAVRDAR